MALFEFPVTAPPIPKRLLSNVFSGFRCTQYTESNTRKKLRKTALEHVLRSQIQHLQECNTTRSVRVPFPAKDQVVKEVCFLKSHLDCRKNACVAFQEHAATEAVCDSRDQKLWRDGVAQGHCFPHVLPSRALKYRGGCRVRLHHNSLSLMDVSHQRLRCHNLQCARSCDPSLCTEIRVIM
jgi:hypothetical protein